jgi:hypothetical protein
MTLPICCMSANAIQAMTIAGTAAGLGIACSEISLVWRQTPKGLDARPGRISGPGGAWDRGMGALAAWPGIGTVTVRDLGRVIAAGRIRDAFDGAATGEMMQLAPALIWSGIPRQASRYYAGLVYLGGILVLAKVRDAVDARRMERDWEAAEAREIAIHVPEDGVAEAG